MSGNGDTQREQEAASEIGRLVAIIEVCAVQAERSFFESQASKRAAERCEQMVAEIKRVVGRLEIRSGAGWRYQLSFVAVTALVGAAVGTAMMYLTR